LDIILTMKKVGFPNPKKLQCGWQMINIMQRRLNLVKMHIMNYLQKYLCEHFIQFFVLKRP
jgi:hypothetical protein